MTSPKSHPRFIPRELRFILSVGLVFFIFEYFVIPQLTSARKSVQLLGRVSPLLVAIAVFLEFASIWAYSELTKVVLTPHAPRLRDIVRVNLSSLALGHILPGGTAAAGALNYRLLSNLGVPASSNGFGLAVQGSGSAVVLNVIFWVALVISIPLRGFNPAYGFAALAGVFLLLTFFGLVFLLTRGQRYADVVLRRTVGRIPRLNPDTISQLLETVAQRINLLVSTPRILTASLLWASANWILDAASLWTFIWAFGYPLSPIDLFVAYGLANILAALPFTPGGLGVVEGVLIPTIVGFGVPHAPAILAVLAYRFVNFWLPIPVGGFAYLSLRWSGKTTTE
jgi:uncharacterized protein (TIRG00374 family)